jgi:hypothetical protein
MKGQRDLEVLVTFFTGNWDSKPGEPPMVLRVGEFWKGSPVRWLYLEWVRPGSEARPVRQLVFRVAEDGVERLTTTVHRLPGDAARYAGEWRKPQPFAGMKPAELKAVWTDPEFDPSLDAFYYVRALQIPTPRWSTYDAKRLGVAPPSGVPATVQERAWSSPIWYTPTTVASTGKPISIADCALPPTA